MYIDTMKEAIQIREEILANRRALHQIPEIGLELPQTVAFVTEKLEQMGIHHSRGCLERIRDSPLQIHILAFWKIRRCTHPARQAGHWSLPAKR